MVEKQNYVCWLSWCMIPSSSISSNTIISWPLQRDYLPNHSESKWCENTMWDFMTTSILILSHLSDYGPTTDTNRIVSTAHQEFSQHHIWWIFQHFSNICCRSSSCDCSFAIYLLSNGHQQQTSNYIWSLNIQLGKVHEMPTLIYPMDHRMAHQAFIHSV